VAAAEREKSAPRSAIVNNETGQTLMLGNIYKDWARNTTEDDK